MKEGDDGTCFLWYPSIRDREDHAYAHLLSFLRVISSASFLPNVMHASSGLCQLP